jgi:hypothetical protein
MTLAAILDQARAIWGPTPTPLPHMAVVLAVVCGDIARAARDHTEGRHLDDTELAKELGNLVLTAVRFMDDLGYRPGHCIGLAADAQATYAREREQ